MGNTCYTNCGDKIPGTTSSFIAPAIVDFHPKVEQNCILCCPFREAISNSSKGTLESLTFCWCCAIEKISYDDDGQDVSAEKCFSCCGCFGVEKYTSSPSKIAVAFLDLLCISRTIFYVNSNGEQGCGERLCNIGPFCSKKWQSWQCCCCQVIHDATD
jgi:hypothetical protein